MHLAISTKSLAINSLEAVDRAVDLGFSAIEINVSGREFGYGYRRQANGRFYRQLQETISKSGLKVRSVTPPSLSQQDMFSVRSRIEILKGSVRFAGLIGAHAFVVEPASIFTSQEAFERYTSDSQAPPVLDGFDETWAQVVNHRMTLALLNRDYWIGTPLTGQPERLAHVARDLAIGVALDIPQAENRAALNSWTELIGERLILGYAYDLTEDGKQHAPLGEKWSDRMSALADSRLKALVIRTYPEQSDERIVKSRKLFEGLLVG